MTLSAQQIEERKSGIGGSDVGCILGLNKYKSPFELYLEKIGEVESPDLSDNETVHFGNVLEDVIADEYARRTGMNVRRRNTALSNKENPWMLANIDRSVDGESMVLECKTAGQYMTGDWGPEGTDEVPDSYMAQVIWYMSVTGYSRADLAVLIGGRDFRIYNFYRDVEMELMVIDKAKSFWFDNVAKKIPPPPSCTRDLETLYASDNGSLMIATTDLQDKVFELKEKKADIKRFELVKEMLEFDIKKEMGESQILGSTEGKKLCTWKSPKPGKRLDGKRLKVEMPQLWKEFSINIDASRRFLVK